MPHTLDYTNRPPGYGDYRRRAERSFPEERMISEEEFNTISAQECHYCGKEGPNGIDRYNNGIGYTSDNCVPCCKHCNYVKGDLTIEDFRIWANRFITKQSGDEAF